MKIRNRVKELRMVPAKDLLANPKNWREHPKEQADAMREVLESVGFAGAVLARETPDGLMLIDGHLRKETAPDATVPVLVLDVTEKEADTILATFDPISAMSTANGAGLKALVASLDLNTGALSAMLDETIAEAAKGLGGTIVEDEAPAPLPDPVSKTGDLWVLGEHRLLCGDSTKGEDVSKLVNKERASLLHADPPYGMGKENEGVENDNLYADKLDAFQMDWWRVFRPHLLDNASAYIWGNAPDLWRLWYRGGLSASERMTIRNEIVWDKREDNPTMLVSGVPLEARRMYQPNERCLFFMLGEQGFNNNAENYWEGWEPIRAYMEAEAKRCGWTVKDINRITGTQMGGHWITKSQWSLITREHYERIQAAARYHDAFKRDHDELKRDFYATRAYFDNTHDRMTDVWSFERVTGEDRHGHATPKPVSMIARAIASSSKSGDVVSEPFSGSGTTIIAAEQLARKCYAIEIEPRYVDVAIRRWSKLTGKDAILEGGKRTFQQIAKARGVTIPPR